MGSGMNRPDTRPSTLAKKEHIVPSSDIVLELARCHFHGKTFMFSRFEERIE